jgi:hypothetical protein
MTQVDGLAHSQQELDPTGVSVGLSNPYDQPGPEIDVGGYTYPFFGSSPYGAGCRIDGIEGNCSLALRFLSSRIGVSWHEDPMRRVTYNGSDVWATFRAYGDGYAGYVPQNARYTGNGGIAPSGSGRKPRLKSKAKGDADRRRQANDTDIGALNGATNEEEELRYVGDYAMFGGGFQWGLYTDSDPHCYIQVKFGGNQSSGIPDFKDGPDKRKLGPYVGNETYTFRFEVSGFVNSNVIGQVGDPLTRRERVKGDLKNGGLWTIGQRVLRDTYVLKYEGIDRIRSIRTVPDDSPAPDIRNVDGQQFAYHDAPGVAKYGGKENTNPLSEFRRTTVFEVYVTSGADTCSIRFEISQSFNNGIWRASITRR